MTWNDLNALELTVYSTTWCPDCTRLKRVLEKHGVGYRDVNIDKDQGAAQTLKEKTNRTAIPYVQIDHGPMVRGWHEGLPGRFDEAVFLREVAEATAAHDAAD